MKLDDGVVGNSRSTGVRRPHRHLLLLIIPLPNFP